MVMIEKAGVGEIEIEQNEVLRYLGYGKNTADENVLAKIEKCISEIKSVIIPKACWEKFPLSSDEEDNLCFGKIKTDSRSLRKNLRGCDEVILFVATIGIETDRIIGRDSLLSPSDAVINQAVGTAFIEKWCDVLCERFGLMEEKTGKYLRPRFSPGYGDLHLEKQKEIFEVLDCPRKIGVSLTESLLMVPSKSVSAIIGLSRERTGCHKSVCEDCGNLDCEFRRC